MTSEGGAPRYEINQTGMIWTCFPVGYDTSELIEISRIGEQWGKYAHSKTGEIIDCKDFYLESQQTCTESSAD